MNSSVRISLIGDIFPSNLPYTIGFGNANKYIKNRIEWEKHLKQFFKYSDISFGNLEAPLLENDKLVENTSFAGSLSFAKTLKNCGIDIVSISNNHILEHGVEGFNKTKEALNNAGVDFVGVYNNEKSNIVVFEKNNLRIGFAAFNAIKDLPNPCLHADLTINSIYKTIEEMKSLSIDFILLSFHWGNEYIKIPSLDQIDLAHKCIDYGANVIVGHHPHVVQPIEKYKEGLIIYSLGNFLFDFLFSKNIKIGMKVDLIVKGDLNVSHYIEAIHLNDSILNSYGDSARLMIALQQKMQLMDRLSNKSGQHYTKYYEKKLKTKHFNYRVMMKLKLIYLILFTANRKRVIRNIICKMKS